MEILKHIQRKSYKISLEYLYLLSTKAFVFLSCRRSGYTLKIGELTKDSSSFIHDRRMVPFLCEISLVGGKIAACLG